MPNAVKEILSGWLGLIVKDEAKEEIAKERAEICQDCPEKKRETFLDWVNDELEDIKGFVCDKCGCPLSPKVRSKTSQCPLDKWPSL